MKRASSAGSCFAAGQRLVRITARSADPSDKEFISKIGVVIEEADETAFWLELRYGKREIGFIAWVGLRGAVGIFLASIPMLMQLPNAQLIFNVAFVVVLASLLVQGWTLGLAARLLDVALPHRDRAVRRVVARGDRLVAGAGVRVAAQSGRSRDPFPLRPVLRAGRARQFSVGAERQDHL